MTDAKRASWRNVGIFSVAVLLIGNLAGLNFNALEGLGGLFFILSPLLVTILLRAFGGDGWADAGFRLSLKGNGGVYLASLLLFPVAFAFALGAGSLTGFVEFQQDWLSALIAVTLTGALPIMIYAFSEEFAWRGYLEPKLQALGVSRILRFLFVGIIWGLWHMGYVLATPGYTALPFALFVPLFMIAILVMTVIYGIWRERTGSFWPAMLAHSVANSLAWPLLEESIVKVETPMWFAARPEGFAVLAVLMAAAFYTMRKA